MDQNRQRQDAASQPRQQQAGPQHQQASTHGQNAQSRQVGPSASSGTPSSRSHVRSRDRLAADLGLDLGDLTPLFTDPDISEVMINGCDKLFIERKGKIKQVDYKFRDNQTIIELINAIVTPLGKVINEEHPYVDARLKDGSRVNAIIPPLSVDGPSITIRRFQKVNFTTKKYLEFGTLTPKMACLLEALVFARLNIIISGGTGAGKTSFLNYLSTFIPDSERIITIEDNAELRLSKTNIVRLETRTQSAEGHGEVTQRELLRNALRMRPDRIIIGECRGAEVLDMFQAMNTGHDGSMTTIHANNARDCMTRLETLFLYSGFDIPLKVIRKQMSGAIDLIIQVSRMKDGSRKITSISEITGMEQDVVCMHDIFTYEIKRSTGRDIEGAFKMTGGVPKFMEKIHSAIPNFPKNFFTPEFQVKMEDVI